MKLNFQKNISILALGAESAGNFSIYKNGFVSLSKDFGDLLNEGNFQKYKKEVFLTLKKYKINPNIILTDLHPLYRTTELGEKLSKQFKAKHFKIQHHLAHIFSAFGENIQNQKSVIPDSFIGIACDGTGYGLDGKIWGGEIFKISKNNLSYFKKREQKSNVNIQRIGHLENQILIGGDLAIKEPARMLISILSKFLEKEEVYSFIKKYYTKNQFELLYNQLLQNFNCQETSSTGRILDAISILLGFCPNLINYKHEPVELLEKNSSKPLLKIHQINPKIIYDKNEKQYILMTTPLFKYLIKNINQDKKQLATASQLYLAKGLFKIAKKENLKNKLSIYGAGGITNNKIIYSYLVKNKVIFNQEIKRGDASLSFGQIFYYLFQR